MKTQILVAGAILVLAHSARAQIFAPSVNVSNAPIQTFGSQQIFVDPAGNGAVVWEEVTGSDPNVRDAVVAVSPASVFAFRKSVDVSKAPTTEPSPRALIDRHLNMFVVWSSTALGGRKILLGRSTDFGQSFTSQTVSDDFGFAPALAEGPNGEIYVAWGKDADNDGLTDSILVIRSDDGGQTFGAPAVASVGASGNVFNPRIGADGAGSVYVKWSGTVASTTGLFVSKSTDGGRTFGSAVAIPNTSAQSRGSNMAVDSSGNVAVIWSEKNNEIRIAYSSNGAASFQTDIPLQGPKGAQVFSPDVAIGSDGKVQTVFSSGTIDDQLVIYAPWPGFGKFAFGSNITDNVGFHGGASVAVDGAGHIDVSWFDDTAGSRQVFVTHPPLPNFKILFVPIGSWSDDKSFFDAVNDQVSGYTNDLPLSSCAALTSVTALQPSVASFASFKCTVEPGNVDCAFPSIRQFAMDQGFDPSSFDLIVGVIPKGQVPCNAGGCSNFKDTLWFEGGCHSLFAHEIGHIFGLKDEYQSIPAGCTDARCNAGDPADCDPMSNPLCGNGTINWLGTDEQCDPRANQGCCRTCDSKYPDFGCCQGNIDFKNKGRSTMSLCDYDSGQTYDQRGLNHLASLAVNQCHSVGAETQALSAVIDLADGDGVTLRDFGVGLARPSRTQGLASRGETEIYLRYHDGGAIYSDSFEPSFAYTGPGDTVRDYSPYRAAAVETTLRVPVDYNAARPRPTTLEVVRHGHTTFRGTIFGTPPVADAGPPQVLECTSPAGATVTLDGSRSSDADGDLLSYAWSGPFGTTADASPAETLPLGTSSVTLTVSDGVYQSSPASTTVTVRDTTPPKIAVSVTPATLWPPDHKMVQIQATVTASDVCDAAPKVVLASITSNEPDSGGDIQDAQLGTLDTSFLLRADRLGTGNGRVYTITYTATDATGNATSASATVTVPHNQ